MQPKEALAKLTRAVRDATPSLRRKDDYRTVFGTEAGRRVLADLARFAEYHADPFVAGDPYGTHVNCGKLRVIQRINQFLGMADAEIIRLAREEGERHGEEFEGGDDAYED